MNVTSILTDALRQWICPSCGGTGVYNNKTVKGGKLVEETLVCKKCAGNGIHPTASQALEKAANNGISQ